MTRLVYILAASHSGSTLLSMLLGSHPQVHTVGELKLSTSAMGEISRYRCSCGELISQCQFWREVKNGMEVRGCDFDLACADTNYRAIQSRYAQRLLGPMHRGKLLECVRDVALSLSFAWRKRLPKIHRRNAALAGTICDITKAEVIIDSSKNAIRLKYLMRNPELDVKVIRLIRDGRGVALTYINPMDFADAKDPMLRGGGSGGDRENERLSMARAAYEWRRANEEAEHVLRCLEKSQWIEVRYEDICRDLDRNLERLFVFLGLNPDIRVRDFRAVQNHVVGNGMRLDRTSQITLDERWRSRLTQEELCVFESTAGKMNARYGYEEA